MTKCRRVVTTAVVVALWLTSTAAYALSCMPPSAMEAQATAVYLIRVTDIEAVPIEHSKHYYEWHGNMQVLKVYRGNVQAVSERAKLFVFSSCDKNWGPPCESVSEPVARVGEQWLIFDLSEDIGYAEISRSECPDLNRLIDETAQLEVFEQDNPPLWVRE